MNYFEIDPTKTDSERLGMNNLQKLNRLMKTKHIILLFFHPQCGHCKSFEPEWNKLVNQYKQLDKLDIIVGKIHANEMEKLGCYKKQIAPNFVGYPTIMHLNKNKYVEDYNDERKSDKIIDWIHKIVDEKDKLRGGSKRKGRRRKGTKRRLSKRKRRTIRNRRKK